MCSQAYIALGSNLQQPEQQLRTALSALKALSGGQVESVSSFYRSAPYGPVQDQPVFINAVVELSTELDPKQLLRALQQIEQVQGRTRATHWGPRTIDLDLLLHGQLVLDEGDLVLPHPGMLQRDFVLMPLQEIAPQLHFPCGLSVQQAVNDCQLDSQLEKLPWVASAETV